MVVRVLVVDDSIFIRRRLVEIFSGHSDIEVVGQACNGREAVTMVSDLKPDVVTMDVEMPEMNGIDAVKNIMANNPTPILMFSVATTEGARATLDALDAGAMDFLPKQLGEIHSDRAKAKQLFCSRVRLLGQRSKFYKRQAIRKNSEQINKRVEPLASKETHRSVNRKPSMLVIAASTGGPVAIQKILASLPQRISIPILLVQHMPGNFTQSFAERLNQNSDIEVREAKNGDHLQPGLALLAPGGFQMEIDRAKAIDTVVIRTSKENENYRPCVDTTLSSIASNIQGHVLAVVLTGMGADGKMGADMLKKKGGSVWAQTEDSCTVYGMPKAVIEANLADRVLDLEVIASELAAL